MSSKDIIAWLLEGDHSAFVFCDAEGKKKIMCAAQVACHTARSSGVTEFSITDHDMTQITVFWASNFFLMVIELVKSSMLISFTQG